MSNDIVKPSKLSRPGLCASFGLTMEYILTLPLPKCGRRERQYIDRLQYR